MSTRLLVFAGVLLLILLGLLAGLARGYGTDLSGVLDVWARVIRSVLFWVIVAAAMIALVVAGVFLVRGRRTRGQRRAISISTADAPQSTDARVPDPPAAIVAPQAPTDHVPGPRDFVPPGSPRAAESGTTEQPSA